MTIKQINEWTERIQDVRGQRERLLEYYEQVGLDYEDWSKGLNMHFGYYSLGINPFDLEAMLNVMNKQVLDKLQLSDYKDNKLLDMGCGLGATVRYALGKYPIGKITGISIVPWQIEQAKKLMQDNHHSYRASFEIEDFEKTRYADETFDGVYAIESASHAKGQDKIGLLREAHRLLKPGKRLVIADAYLKRNDNMLAAYQYCYEKMCEYWAVEEFGCIDDVKQALYQIGYREVAIKEISWRIAPSVLFIPFVATKFFFQKVLPQLLNNKQRWNHFMASVYSMIVGMNRRRFGYYLIVAKK